MPNEKGNLCIAGHNYNDNRFFGKINSLSKNDIIVISNNLSEKFYYYVYNKFEVRSNDVSSVISSTSYPYELTLITCNNYNGNRIVVKSKKET